MLGGLLAGFYNGKNVTSISIYTGTRRTGAEAAARRKEGRET